MDWLFVREVTQTEVAVAASMVMFCLMYVIVAIIEFIIWIVGKLRQKGGE